MPGTRPPPKILVRSKASDGELIFSVGTYVYEVWMDAALLPSMIWQLENHPMQALHVLRKRVKVWKRREDLE